MEEQAPGYLTRLETLTEIQNCLAAETSASAPHLTVQTQQRSSSNTGGASASHRGNYGSKTSQHSNSDNYWTTNTTTFAAGGKQIKQGSDSNDRETNVEQSYPKLDRFKSGSQSNPERHAKNGSNSSRQEDGTTQDGERRCKTSTDKDNTKQEKNYDDRRSRMLRKESPLNPNIGEALSSRELSEQPLKDIEQELEVKRKMKEYGHKMETNKNCTFEKMEMCPTKFPCPKGFFAYNCRRCRLTCEKQIKQDNTIRLKTTKRACYKEGCTCPASEHVYQQFEWRLTPVKIPTTLKDVKVKYESNPDRKVAAEQLLADNLYELNMGKAKVFSLLEQVNINARSLESTALRSNALTPSDYLSLIKSRVAEEQAAGYRTRLETLTKLQNCLAADASASASHKRARNYPNQQSQQTSNTGGASHRGNWESKTFQYSKHGNVDEYWTAKTTTSGASNYSFGYHTRATSGLSLKQSNNHSAITRQETAEYDSLQTFTAHGSHLGGISNQWNDRSLESTALRSNAFTPPDYFSMLRSRVAEEQSPGYLTRLETLTELQNCLATDASASASHKTARSNPTQQSHRTSNTGGASYRGNYGSKTSQYSQHGIVDDYRMTRTNTAAGASSYSSEYHTRAANGSGLNQSNNQSAMTRRGTSEYDSPANQKLKYGSDSKEGYSPDENKDVKSFVATVKDFLFNK